MVRETNRYADQYFQGKGGEGNLKLHARAVHGNGETPNICPRLYWSNSWLLDLGLKQVIVF